MQSFIETITFYSPCNVIKLHFIINFQSFFQPPQLLKLPFIPDSRVSIRSLERIINWFTLKNIDLWFSRCLVLIEVHVFTRNDISHLSLRKKKTSAGRCWKVSKAHFSRLGQEPIWQLPLSRSHPLTFQYIYNSYLFSLNSVFFLTFETKITKSPTFELMCFPKVIHLLKVEFLKGSWFFADHFIYHFLRRSAME